MNVFSDDPDAGAQFDQWLRELPAHPATADCPVAECDICSMRDCPEHDPLHYHHDGCPSCVSRDHEEEDR